MTIYSDYEELLNNRLGLIVLALKNIEFPRTPPYAAVTYLHDLLVEGQGHLSGLTVEVKAIVTNPGGSSVRMTYDLAEDHRTLQVDHRFIDAFDKAKAKFGEDLLPGVVDCFLIHEFLHYAQGMGHGRYSGLSSQAPNTLLAIDYQADAMAVIALSMLALLRPDNYSLPADIGVWDIYRHAISLALGQMEVFTHQMSRELDRGKVSNQRFSLDKLQRTAIWQYQFHRAVHFNRDRSLADFQILSQPHLHFRNLEAAWAEDKNFIRKNWPSSGESSFFTAGVNAKSGYELRPGSDPFCVLAAPSPHGTTGFVRSNNDFATNALLFDGLFDGDLEKSEKFFAELFKENPWLIGNAGGTDPGDPGGGGNTPPPEPRPGGATPLRELLDHQKLKLLEGYLASTTVPLTTMEMPVIR